MRSAGYVGRLLASVASALTLAACGAVQASPPASQTTTAPPSAMETITAQATATATISATTPATPAAAVRSAPRYGNPGGTAPVPPAAGEVSSAHPNHVIGSGTPASCTSAAVVRAVAAGGVITFNCGPNPVTITMTATAKIVNTHRRTVLDGGGKVTLSGGGKLRILYMNTCDPKQVYTTSDCWEQEWPQLVVQNLTFENAYSPIRQSSTSAYGGGAIFDEGGQLKVVNSGFINDKCYAYGPDLGGGAVRALGMWQGSPVYITRDTFRGGRCSNGAALSSIDAKWTVLNSFFGNNDAIGWGQNPQQAGTPGGGSGGAIYTDGNSYSVLIDGTVIRYCNAREGGGAVFFVVDNGAGTLTIENSTLYHNLSGQFQNAPGIFDSVDGHDTPPVLVHSTVN
jgi:hypothetical protein